MILQASTSLERLHAVRNLNSTRAWCGAPVPGWPQRIRRYREHANAQNLDLPTAYTGCLVCRVMLIKEDE